VGPDMTAEGLTAVGPDPTAGAATEAGVVLAGGRTMGRGPGPQAAATEAAKEVAKPHRATPMGRDGRLQGVVNKEAAKPHRAIPMARDRGGADRACVDGRSASTLKAKAPLRFMPERGLAWTWADMQRGPERDLPRQG
jgi:hypothetical protein